MANIAWAGKSGAWGMASNWGTSGVPTDLDAVTISVPGALVSVDAGVAASAYTLFTNGSSLLLDGGSLTTIHNATYYGAFTQTSGTLTMEGTGASFYGNTWLAGGTVNVSFGHLQIEHGAQLGGGSIGGTATTLSLVGSGVLELVGGSTYINTGFSCKLAGIVLDYGAKLGFNTSYVTGRSITANYGTVDLFGHTLTLNGTSLFSGVLGNGTVNVVGNVTLGSTLYSEAIDNGLVVAVTGTVVQANNLYQGATDSGAKIIIGKTGHYDIDSNWNISDPSTTATITNSGVFAKTGGGKVSRIDTSLSSKGTIQAGIGELELNGLVNSISGTVSGAGTLGIAGGQTTLLGKVALNMAAINQHSGLLIIDTPQSYANQWEMSGGYLNLNHTSAVLTLTGNDSFDGGVITGYGGVLNFNGTTEFSNLIIGGPNHYNFNGPVDQTGSIYFGQSSNPVGTIAAASSWMIEGDSLIQGEYGLLINKGVFGTPNGSGDAQVYCQLSSTGTVLANSSTLTLAGTELLGGTLAGTGLLDLAGTTTLQSGLVISVAALDVSGYTLLAGNLSDAGAFSEYYLGQVDTNGHTLTLTGTTSLDQGSVTDLGTISTAGQTTVGYYTVTGGAELLIRGTADQTSTVTADGGTLAIAGTGTYSVLDDLSIYGTGTVLLNGTLAETGTGYATIAPTLQMGPASTLAANDQMLALNGGGTLAGRLTGAGMIDLNAGTYALSSGLSLLSAGLEVTGAAVAVLQANESYAGDFQTINSATIQLGGKTLNLTGTAELTQGYMTGPGTLAVAGAATIGAITVAGDGTLSVTGTAEQLGNMQLGSNPGTASAASLSIGSSGIYTMDAGASIYGSGTLSVTGGTVIADGNGTSIIQGSIVDAGTIAANLGTLSIQGSVTATGAGTGSFSIGSAGFLDFSNTATISLFTYVTFGGAGAQLRIDDIKDFGATLKNFATGDAIQIGGLNGSAATLSYASADHTSILVTDTANNQITLQFASAQTLGSLSIGANASGIATLVHH